MGRPRVKNLLSVTTIAQKKNLTFKLWATMNEQKPVGVDHEVFTSAGDLPSRVYTPSSLAPKILYM